MSENAKEWIKSIIMAIVLAAICLCFVQPVIVREHSMENTLHSKDFLIVSKQTYGLFGGAPQRGDIIVFKSDLMQENGSKKLLIKRVIALPGETIEIRHGDVYINGEILQEDYLKDGYTTSEMPEVKVPADEYFCMGDNRQNSADSRDSRIGTVHESLIFGKAVVRLFPFNKIGTL